MSGTGYLSLKSKSQSNASLLLNRVKDVFKIVNVEAEFSEIFQEKTYTLFDFGPFKKSVIVRVKARVLIGYDLDSSSIKLDSTQKIITLKFNPQPQVISNEMNIDYYNIQQGTFNQFSADELNMIHDKVRDIILRRVEKEDFFGRARKRQIEFVNTVQSFCDLLGWKLKIENKISAQPN